MNNQIVAIIIAIVTSGVNSVFTHTFHAPTAPVEHSIQRKVFNDDPRPIRGTVKKPNLDPLPSATVRLYTTGSTLLQTVSTDASGFYEFSPVLPGAYLVKASATGYKDSIVTVPVPNTVPYVIQDFILQEE